MSNYDKQLIEQAEKLKDWDLILSLSEQTESQEAKRRIKKMAVSLYHKEEFACGIL